MKRHIVALVTSIIILTLLVLGSSSITELTGKGGAGTGMVATLLGESMLVALLFVACVFLLSVSVHYMESRGWNVWKYIEGKLMSLFVIVWIVGFSVYCTGMFIGTADQYSLHKLLSVGWMAVLHAFGMFILESDISAVHEQFHNNVFFMMLFSVVHFAAAFVSMVFVIKHFGYNLVAGIHLWLTARYSKSKDNLYVFWGMNDASYHLAKDIVQTYSSGKKTEEYNIVVVNTADEDENEADSNRTSFGRLFNFLSFNNEELERYKDLGCLTINTYHKLSKINIEEDADDTMTDIICGKLHCHSLARLIHNTKVRTHIFLFGNNEEENIIGTGNLCKDSSICEYIKQGGKLNIYCHARYDSINRVVEDRYSSGSVDIKVVDSSHSSINILRSTPSYHPVNFVDIDTENNLGTVKSGFTSLVVGFGETGRDAVRYLYEFGAFVHNHSSKTDTEEDCRVSRSPFNCYVVDREASKIGGLFFSNAPAIKGVNLWNVDINTPAFFENLSTVVQKLNYVVVALGNDELNITTAVRLFNYIRRNRVDMTKLKIFVRCHNHKQKRHLQNIADHYNEKNVNGKAMERIIIFGTEEQLYTYEQIIENDFQHEGIQYNTQYCEASGKKGEKDIWESRHRILISSKSLDNLSELRRKESQDIANAYHAQTKLFIMEAVARKRGLSNILDCLKGNREAPRFVRDGQQIVTEDIFSDEEQLLFRNLARLEHIRWNAAHEVLGYQSYADGDPTQALVPDEGDKRHSCNETFKLHNCLIDWNNLDAEMNDPKNIWHPDYVHYDYIVVTTTLILYNMRKK